MATPDRKLDPMAREVDRLLAKLANSGPQPAQNGAPPASTDSGKKQSRLRRPRTVVLSANAPTRVQLAPLWARLVLGLALGAAMTQWPYRHACDLALLGYLGAVAAVLIAGVWAALAAWRLRVGPAHLVALTLVFWGFVLAAEEALPRVGYAAHHESWRCVDASGGGGH